MWQVFVAWALCLGVLVAGALMVCPGGQCQVGVFDQVGLGIAHDLRGVALDSLMQGVTWLGSLALLIPLMVVLAWTLFRRGRRGEARFVLLALLGASALSHLVKLWLMRPRPDLFPPNSPLPLDWSYPSAHSMQIAAAAVAIFLVAGRRGAIPLATLLAALVLLVGLSRIYLQVHFPSDVLAGVMAGTLWVFGLHALMFSKMNRQQDKGASTGGMA